MKTQKENEKKTSPKGNSFPLCGDFQKMAEMMKTRCPSEGNVVDCCSMMKRMMLPGKEAETKETKGTQKEQKGEENG